MAIYFSSIILPFGFTDDYLNLDDEMLGKSTVARVCIGQGRPLDGYFIHSALAQLSTVGDLRWVRLATIVFLATCCFVVYLALVRSGWNSRLALPMALAVGAMPAAQVYVCWAVEVAKPLAGAMAGLAAFLAAKSLKKGGRAHPIFRIVGAAGVLTMALTIYQPAAMLFWVFAAIDLFRPAAAEPLKDLWRRVGMYIVIGLLAMCLGFAVLKAGAHFYPPLVSETRANVIGIADVWMKLKWFLHEPMVNALNLTKLFRSYTVAIAAGSFIFVGLIIFFGGGGMHRMWLLLLAAAILPASYLPNLLTTEYWASYRTQFALESLLLFYSVLAVHGYWRFIATLARGRPCGELFVPVFIVQGAAAALCICAAYTSTIYFTWPQTVELKFVQSLLTADRLKGVSRILILRSSFNDSVAPGVRYDEFGLPSTCHSWVAVPMVRLLLREQHFESSSVFIEGQDNLAAAIELPGPQYLPPETLILDLRGLRRFGWNGPE